MSLPRIACIALVLTLPLLNGGATEPPAPTQEGSWALSAGSVVYESHGDGYSNIHRYDAGAPRPRPLTSHRANDRRPRWSPDGTRVAFHSDLEGAKDVYIVNADGSGLQRVTDHPGEDFDPDWMPDGRLVFASDRDGDQNIWVLDLETDELAQLTHYPGGRTGGPTPAGDGRRIAFSSDGMFSWQVYLLDLESGEIERLTGPLPGRCNPAWNPTSDRIAYMAGGDLIGTDLRSLTPSGDDARDLASSEGDNQDPQFSQDGTRLVWVTDRHGNWEIYEAAADGRGEHRVSTSREDERHPDLFSRATR